MKITIPNHKAISWNKLTGRMHWTKRAKLVQEISGLVRYGNTYTGIIAEKVDISITAYYKDKRRHDSDNVCAKLYIDGLKGLIEDDDTRYVGKVTTQAKIGQKEDKVLITIKEIV